LHGPTSLHQAPGLRPHTTGNVAALCLAPRSALCTTALAPPIAIVLPWACLQVPHTKVLRFINRLAGAIHRAAPGALVTVGAHSVPYITDLPMPGLWYPNAPMNYFSDNLLVSGTSRWYSSTFT
jgi:hypothetical protein